MNTEPHKVEFNANFVVVLILAITVILSCVPVLMFMAWGFVLLVYYFAQNSDFVRERARHIAAVYMSYAVVQVALAAITLVVLIVTGIVSSYAAFFGGLQYTVGATVGQTVMSVLGGAATLVYAIFAVIAAVKAYKYESYRIPLVFGFAEQWVDKILAKIDEKLTPGQETPHDESTDV